MQKDSPHELLHAQSLFREPAETLHRTAVVALHKSLCILAKIGAFVTHFSQLGVESRHR